MPLVSIDIPASEPIEDDVRPNNGKVKYYNLTLCDYQTILYRHSLKIQNCDFIVIFILLPD